MAWLQPVRLAAEAGPRQRWSNFRYFRLLPWVRTTGELRLSPHRRRGEGVGVRIGVGEHAPILVDLYRWLCVHSKVRQRLYTYTRIRLSAYFRLES